MTEKLPLEHSFREALEIYRARLMTFIEVVLYSLCGAIAIAAFIGWFTTSPGTLILFAIIATLWSWRRNNYAMTRSGEVYKMSRGPGCMGCLLTILAVVSFLVLAASLFAFRR